MEIFEAIIGRRSIRKYREGELSDEQLDTLLKAAMYAPSAVNKRPWHFMVIDDRELMLEITRLHPHSQMLKEASIAILVMGDEKLEHAPGYHHADCGAATQNILLAAHGMGLGAVWIGVYPREHRMQDIAELFDLPSHIKPYSIVSVGYPGEEKEAGERVDKEKLHYNKW